MNLRFTILGCGSSGGVPRIGGNWGACDPANPRNRRRRCSLLVERRTDTASTTVLIDTSPDMREQLLDAGVRALDGVLYTHEHADHLHGIDDLRVLALSGRHRVQVWSDADTYKRLERSFGYCFHTPPGSEYPPICDHHLIELPKPVVVTGEGGAVEVQPFDQAHGSIRSLGFRIANVAYSSDLNDLPEESVAALQDLDVWIVDALRYTFHPSHFSLEDTLSWIARIRPGRAVLTNMHIDMDYDTLRRELPENVEPAYDGMVIAATL